ncbi:dihydroorotate dehydrogenase-like protein [bacterium]|nr:dihydroorotate dehydrogenase-like protein [bacterium]
MLDLETSYLGLTLKNPLVASASPLTSTLSGICRLARAGVAAVVLESLFEEQVELEVQSIQRVLSGGTDSYAEALSYFPQHHTVRRRPAEYIRLIESCCTDVDIPIIASLNGVTPGGWLEYARQFEQAGASAVELNLYRLITDPEISAAQAEEQYVEVVRHLTTQLRIPVAVKISPFFSSLPHFARQLAGAGARGLVLFNRFYQPDFDLEQLEVVPRLELSRPQELLLPLTWTAILHGRVDLDLAITSGVHSATDVCKAMMAGARAVLLASRLLHDGPESATSILDDLRGWMQQRDYHSIRQMQGSMSQSSVSDPAAFERANYMKTLHSY